ncbi:hypothetical protein JL49_20765 [Pseudoalteromonas luteoviolacea]|nr:hypothetical protein JL49_20765 [Pseudoalteromonas luteoviolacea]
MIAALKNKLQSSLWKKALSDSSHYLISSLIIKSLSILIVPLITRTISVEEFAIYDLFLILNSFAIVLLSLGIDSGIAIIISENQKDNGKLGKFLKLNVIFSFLAWLFSFLVISALNYSGVIEVNEEILLLFSVYTLFTVITYALVNFCRWVGLVKVAAYMNLFCTLLGYAFGVGLLFYTQSITYYFYGLMASGVASTLLLSWLLRSYLFGKSEALFEKKDIYDLLKLSLPYVPNYLTNHTLAMIDRYVILALLDQRALGLYALVSRIANLPNMVVNIVASGFLPILFKNIKTPEGKKFIAQVLHLYFCAVPIVVLSVVLGGEYLIYIIGGDKYTDASPMLSYMILSSLIVSSTYLSGLSYNVKRKTEYIFYISLLVLFLNLILSYMLCQYYGVLGVVYGTLISSVVRAALYINLSEKLIRFGYNQLFILASFVIALIMIVI